MLLCAKYGILLISKDIPMSSNHEIMTSEQRALFEALTPFQKRLAPALLSGLKYVDAYRKAQPSVKNSDTSARVIVNRTANNKKFKAYMDSMLEGIVSEAIMDRTEALEKLSTLARGSFGTMVDFKNAEIGNDPVTGDPVEQAVWRFKDSSLQDAKQLETIAELSSSQQGIKIKLHSPIVAIQQLSAIQGWTKPLKLDHSSPDGTMTPKAAPAIDVSKLSTGAILEILEAYDQSTSTET